MIEKPVINGVENHRPTDNQWGILTYVQAAVMILIA